MLMVLLLHLLFFLIIHRICDLAMQKRGEHNAGSQSFFKSKYGRVRFFRRRTEAAAWRQCAFRDKRRDKSGAREIQTGLSGGVSVIVQIFKPLETDNDTFDGNKIGEIPGFTSYTYTKHWQRPGTFELTFISGSSADETKIAEDTVLLVD